VKALQVAAGRLSAAFGARGATTTSGAP
jgi:hypothetical protein